MRKFYLFLCVLYCSVCYAQYDKVDVEDYILRYKEYAIEAQRTYKIPVSIKLAQAIYSSQAGKSKLCKEANNHFGVLCHAGYLGESYYETVDKSGDCFRKYRTAKESYADHSLFLAQRSRYADLFKLDSTDYKGWAQGLQAAGYSINEKYAGNLINIIETYHLYQYDKTGSPMVVSGIEVYVEPSSVEVPEKSVKKTEKPAPAVTVEEPVFTKVFTAKERQYKVAYQPYMQRNVYENNKTKFVIAKKNDSFANIAKEAQISEETLRGYNDIYKEYEPVEGEVIYLQTKNTKSKVEYHTIAEGESFRYIAQRYGIQLKTLLKRNGTLLDSFAVGDRICVGCK